MKRFGCPILFLSTCLLSLAPVASPAADGAAVTFTSVAPARTCTALLEHDGILYGGLQDGGLMVWPIDDPDAYRHLTVSDGLTDLHVTDICWSGRYVWVATESGGLTRIDPTDDFAAAQFASAGELELTAVTGLILGNQEWVYYGIANGGLGQINGVLSGEPYISSAEPGLASDMILGLAVGGEDVWIGTDTGVSLLRDGVITNVSAGLPHTLILDIVHVEGIGPVVSTFSGVLAYDEDAGAWNALGSLSGYPLDLAWCDGALWALATGGGADRLFRWDDPDWTPLTLNDADVDLIGGTDALFAVGTHRLSTLYDKAQHVFYERFADGAWTGWTNTPELGFTRIAGVDIDARGRIWMGSFNAGGFAWLDGSTLGQVNEVASVANDSIGLFNNDANVLDVAVTTDGALWATQYSYSPTAQVGLLRYDPEGPDMAHVTPDNSGLPGVGNIALRAHPEGPLLALSDQDGVAVLADPARWDDPAQWVQLPTDSSGLNGDTVLDACCDGPDRVWFAVKLQGLVLWDVNGSASSDAPLTWTDTSDDLWLGPIDELDVDGQADPLDVTGLNSVAVGEDGTYWLGGSFGLVHLSLDDHGGAYLTAGHLDDWGEKLSASMDGLQSVDVQDIQFDRNGDLWVAHGTGLDRVRRADDGFDIDAYTSIDKFFERSLGSSYGNEIIEDLPPSGVFKLAADADGRRLAGGTLFGAVLIDVGPAPAPAAPLAELFCWPNPFKPLEHADGLRIGGTDALVTWSGFVPGGGARVEIYNLEGQLVYRDKNVTDGEGFWDGRTLEGQAVASGPYLVRVEYQGETTVKPLAVVY